jgi:hypothetical protein
MNVALICGINAYPNAPLRGCLNDTAAIRDLLCANGFSPMHVKILKDSMATKNNILCNLKNMVERAQEGDHLVFWYSGHGTQIPCGEGDEPEDGLDECLVPYDFNWINGMIKDDEICNIIKDLNPRCTLDVGLDACHSGTGLREPDVVAKFIPYPFAYPGIRSFKPLLKELDQPNVALFSGCKSNQTSADAYIDSKYQGAFTYAFTKAMKVLPAMSDSPIISRQRLIDRINYILRADNYEQIPQLEASDEMKLRRIFT